MKPFKLLTLACVTALLAACGGGGTSDTTASGATPPAGTSPTAPPAQPTTPVAPLTVTGVASKGILTNALVKVLAITPQGPSSQVLASGRTDENGRYSLSIPGNSGPIMVQIETVPGETRMLDETQRWQGEFRSMAAPQGLILRAVGNTAMAQGTLQLNVTPLTEGAVEVAARLKDAQGQSLAWSTSAFSAAQQWTLQMAPAGVDPFTTVPTGLAGVERNSAAQNKALVQLMGFMQHAATCVDDGNLVSGQDVLCALQKLRDSTPATLDGNNLKFQFADRMQDLRYRWQTAAVTAAAGSALSDLAKTELASLRSTPGSITPLTLNEAGSELERFVKGLREGFRATEATLNETDAALQRRYSQLTSTGAEAVLDAADYIDNECQLVNDRLVCGSFWAAKDGGFERLSSSPLVRGGSVTTRIRVTGDKASGYRANYTSTQALGTRTLSKAEFDITVKGVDESGRLLGKTAQLSIAGNFTAWEDNDPNQWARIDLRRLEMSGVDDTVEELDLAGDIQVSSSLGDQLSGSLEFSGRRKRNSVNSDAQVNRLYAQLRADVTPLGSVQFASLTVLGSATPLEYSSLGYGTYSLQAVVELTSKTRMTLQMSKSSANLATAIATVAAGGYELILSVEASGKTGRYCLAGDNADLCSNLIRVSTRDGRFTAVVDGTTLTGDIYYENQKVGRITRNSVNINGQEFSFY